ncbi:MAG: dihydroorotase family protein [Candidatus Levybacteria bacterium]|nr:dihydroorotase family protein [Candidatus Levybacteria bacterium]
MTGKLILPGLIDPHVHLRDPGQTHKEDFYTGTTAALAGGFTTILDMPNNKVPITTLKILNEKIKIAKEKIVCDVGFYFGSVGDNLKEFPKIINKVFGLKLYLSKTTGNFLIDKNILEETFIAWKKSSILPSIRLFSDFEKPILVHAEDDMLDAVITLAKKFGNKVHVCHISTALDLKQIIKAKEEDSRITCGVTPHHLFLTENDVKRLGPFGKMKPQLTSKKNQDFLWKNLKYIDVIESDHAPHTIEEKRGEIAPFGVPGLETTLPLLLTAVSEKRLAIEDVVRLCHINPAKIFGIKTNYRTKVVVDLNSSFIIHNSSLFTKCKWSPFEGFKVKGKVQRVFIRGKKVFENNKIPAKPGFGKIITP